MTGQMTAKELIAMQKEKASLEKSLNFYSCFEQDDSAQNISKLNTRLYEVEERLKRHYQAMDDRP